MTILSIRAEVERATWAAWLADEAAAVWWWWPGRPRGPMNEQERAHANP